MFSRILHTIKHLKFIQILYQVKYRIFPRINGVIKLKQPHSITPLNRPDFVLLEPFILKPISSEVDTFTFLNISHKFTGIIDWNFKNYGMLWTYNLNYMDYVIQQNAVNESSLQLIWNYIDNISQRSIGLDPYPTSLRIINWIKFLSINEVSSEIINSSLYAQCRILSKKLEYHLMANHILENGFSLIFGAFYFKDKELYKIGSKIIKRELKEQILNDGAHFELTPMYHQILLDRLLDCINLLKNNIFFNKQDALLNLMNVKATRMLSWLNSITFKTGEIPLLNDSAVCIAPTTEELNQYALRLGFSKDIKPAILIDSGYRKYFNNKYECVLDIGNIGPSYQPGHAHADTFNFVLNIYNNPFIIDQGVSTYENGEIRLKERGTAAHNTVTINDNNSSDVWSSFRVGLRAKVKVIKDDFNHIIAQHNGFRNLHTTHKREWIFSDNSIIINDTITGKKKNGTFYLWLSPAIIPTIIRDNFIETDLATIEFTNATSVSINISRIPDGYNKYVNTNIIKVSFCNHLLTKINTKD
ncbi:MAG TPA: hypothetical protein DEO54_07815 [Rikenellaceae bacterium]|nr:MAG: hypothetical protein A2X20_02260 [Bacteroidetes bacterium GWE2_40_15]HBZ26131.1 hypothetical protein [Rikenellaceae bacterium]